MFPWPGVGQTSSGASQRRKRTPLPARSRCAENAPEEGNSVYARHHYIQHDQIWWIEFLDLDCHSDPRFINRWGGGLCVVEALSARHATPIQLICVDISGSIVAAESVA